MGDQFEMHTAFSREGPSKVYVQHLLKQQGKEINELLEKKAYFYVCGDAANMAREVNTVLAQIIAEHRGVSEAKAEEIVKNMRAANQYQVRPHTSQPQNMVLTDYLGGCLVIESQPVLITFSVNRGPFVPGLAWLNTCVAWLNTCVVLGIQESWAYFENLFKFSKPRKIKFVADVHNTIPLVNISPPRFQPGANACDTLRSKAPA